MLFTCTEQCAVANAVEIFENTKYMRLFLSRVELVTLNSCYPHNPQGKRKREEKHEEMLVKIET